MSSVSFRIVSLPRELQTANEVTWYVENVACYGAVESVDINNSVAPNGARFSSATVRMKDSIQWTDSQPALHCAGKSGVLANSYYEDKTNGELVQFHFDNGKSMLHIKHVIVDAPKSVQLSDEETVKNFWNSIYIPVVPIDIEMSKESCSNTVFHTEEGLKRFFEDTMNLGNVSRIDFVSRSITDSTSSVRSAYVHFSDWNDNQTAHYVRAQIDGRGEFKCDGYYQDGKFMRFSNRRFMVFKMNRSPIPEANPEANVHQLAARNAELEAQLEELTAKFTMLETMNDKLKEKLGESQIEAACLWNVMAEETEQDAMTMEELMV